MLNHVFLAILWLLLHLPVVAQTPAQQANKASTPVGREGVITGRVIGEDGQPIAKAMVRPFPIGGTQVWLSPVLTDADGGFKLSNLSPAPYVLTTIVPGYVVDRASRQTDYHHIGEHVTLNLVRGGVITGQVTDAAGEPMVAVRVIPKLVRDLDGNPVPIWNENGQMARMTDDRGIYRLYGLEPGIYVVFIKRSFEYMELVRTGEVSIYYPSATRDGAAEITVQSGQEITGIDIRHRVDRGHIASGRIVGEIGAAGDFNRTVVMMNNLADGQVEAGTNVTKSGGFEIRGLADGDYEIMASRTEDGRSMSASMPRKVTIRGTDVSGIELKVERLGSISGRVVMETLSKPGKCDPTSQSSPEEILFNAKSIQGTSSNSILMMYRGRVGWNGGGVDKKGEFKLTSMFAGNYQLVADLPVETWFIRSITRPGSLQNGVRLAASFSNGLAIKSGENVTGIEAKIADGAASISGKVVPASEDTKLPKHLRIHLIPSETAAADDVLRYRELIAASDGWFEFKHLAPGKYWLLTKSAIEKEQGRPVAWDAIERMKLRREAEAAKNEIELGPCQHEKDRAVRFN